MCVCVLFGWGADPRIAFWRVWAPSQVPVPVLLQEVPLVGLSMLSPVPGRSQWMGLYMWGADPRTAIVARLGTVPSNGPCSYRRSHLVG